MEFSSDSFFIHIFSWSFAGLMVSLILGTIIAREIRGGIMSMLTGGIPAAIIGGVIGSMVFNLDLTHFEGITVFTALVGASSVILLEKIVLREKKLYSNRPDAHNEIKYLTEHAMSLTSTKVIHN